MADEASIDKDSLGIFPEKSVVIFDACPTGEARVEHTSRANLGVPGGKGSGRELEVEEEREQEEEKEIAVNRYIVAQARPRIVVQDVLTIFNHWRSTFQHSQALLDHKRKKFIHQALKMGYSVQQLCDAITGCANTPHNMGDN